MSSVNDTSARSPKHSVPVEDSTENENRGAQRIPGATLVRNTIIKTSPQTRTTCSSYVKGFAAVLESLTVDAGPEATTMSRFLEEGAREQACLVALSGEVAGLNISRPRISNADAVSCELTNLRVKCLE